MLLQNIPVIILALLLGNSVSGQIYLSKEMPTVVKKWNGNTFTSEKSFVDNIKEVSQFSILSKILDDELLVEELDNNEMVTIFAVSDTAFSHLGEKQRDSLLGNKNLMKSMVKFMAVPGRIDRHGLEKEAGKRNGTFYLSTLNGENLGVVEKDGQLHLVDPQGRHAPITDADFYHENGLFHIVGGLVFPNAVDLE